MGRLCQENYGTREAYEELFDEARGIIRQCAYAPERPGAPDIEEFEDFLSKRGITMAVGHTEMSPPELNRAVSKGASIVTHLFDAMGCWRGNESISCTGVIQETAAEVALAKKGLYYELICDSLGVHVKPANLRLAYRAAGIDNLIIITDSTIQEHRPEDYPPWDMRSAKDLNFNHLQQLSGSRLTMEMSAQNFRRFTGASVAEVFAAASRNPAKAVGIYDKVGSLEAGKEANFIFCDENIAVRSIYLRGNPVR
jgi:N-acetylglucosamine-6-phosphate deacetylase